jgi:Predicted metal-dependent hydrolase
MIDRRDMLALGTLGALTLGTSSLADAAPVTPDQISLPLHGRQLRVLDLTHRLTRAFAFTPGRLSMEAVEGSGTKAGMALNRICIVEHTGTHLDAPRHFSPEGASVGDIAISQLIVPLVIIDIREKAKANRDARVEPKDVAAWERRHGRIPAGSCVAMLSGWDPLGAFANYGSLPPAERRKSPGFDTAVMDILMQRDVRGISVDTMSIDAGQAMPAFPVHQAWLRSGRWALEGLANLDRAPAAGALLFAGVAPLENATGMPARVIALY